MEPLTGDDPQEIGGYRLHARLGAGGMGRVYLAYTRGGRAVAVKVMRPELGDDPRFRQRFRQEIDAAARVHGLYTAQVIDADPTAPAPWIVTAYVPGPSLDAVVAQHGPMPMATVFRLTAGIAEALQAIHAAGVVHRDLKPSNVLLAPDGPRVIDFGIARAAEATSLTRTGLVVGSPQFMAPEQIEGRPANPATDIFGLGSLAAYAALGRAPFGGADGQAVLYRILHQEPDLEGCPEPLRALILRCLAKDPAARPRPDDIVRLCQDALPEDATQPATPWLPAEATAELTRRSTMIATRPATMALPGGPPPPPTMALPGRPPPAPTMALPPQPIMMGPPPPQRTWIADLTPPTSVVTAVGLMCAGAAAAVLNGVAGSIAVYDLISRYYQNAHYSAPTNTLAVQVTLQVVYALVGAGLWLWMAAVNRAGRGWARIVSTILFALLTADLPQLFLQIPYLLPRITAIIQWTVALAALILLWVGPSNAYFRAQRRSRTGR